MKSKLTIAAIAILAMFSLLYGAGTTVNGTRVINGDLTVKGSCTGCGATSGLTLVEQHTAATSSTLNFTTGITSTYDDYLIEIVSLIPTTNSVHIDWFASTDGGMNYDTGANYGWVGLRFVVAGSACCVGANSGASLISLDAMDGADTVSNSVSGGGLSGTYRLYNPLSAASNKLLRGETVANAASFGGPFATTESAFYFSTTAVNAFQIKPSGGGTLASGTVRLYGIAK